ncbi:replication initiation protein, partial [Salmonella enterica]
AIGKSIAKYTHRNFTPETFAQYVADTHTPEIQAARGRRSKRGAVATSERTLKPWEKLGISRAWYYQLKKRGLVE